MTKKNLAIVIVVSVIMLATGFIAAMNWLSSRPFRLDDAYYGTNEQININGEQYEKLIESRASFIVFVDAPNCITADGLRNMLADITSSHPVQIHHIMWDEAKNTSLRQSIDYFPSIALINQGRVVDALQANSNDYTKYYNSKNDLKDWLTHYIHL